MKIIESKEVTTNLHDEFIIDTFQTQKEILQKKIYVIDESMKVIDDKLNEFSKAETEKPRMQQDFG